jgi:hypothetical protein
MSDELPFEVVRSNGTDEVLARAVHLLNAGGAYREAARRRQHRHCIVEGEGRSDSAPDIEHDLADSSPHRILGTHRIRPEPVQLALLERARCRDAERHARLVRRWNAYDPHPVPLEVDTGFDEHPLEHQGRPAQLLRWSDP